MSKFKERNIVIVAILQEISLKNRSVLKDTESDSIESVTSVTENSDILEVLPLR